jgi:hypothetical protein
MERSTASLIALTAVIPMNMPSYMKAGKASSGSRAASGRRGVVLSIIALSDVYIVTIKLPHKW